MSDTLIMENNSLNETEAFNSRLANLDSKLTWLIDLKKKAWADYQRLPVPTRTNETWRFSRLDKIRDLSPYILPATTEDTDEAVITASKRLETVSGRLIFLDDQLISEDAISSELTNKGVIFCSLAEAMIKHPDLVQKYLTAQSPELGSEKYEALHLALLENGTFLYVPDNVEVEAPFVVYNWAKQDKGSIFPHTIYVTGKGAKASLIEFQECVDFSTTHLAIANTDLFADDGSKPKHTIVQNWNENTLSFQLNTNNAQTQTDARSVLINLGSTQARQEIHGKIFGSESNVEIYSLTVPHKDQEIDQRTLQTHLAPQSRSDLLFRNALLGEAKTIFSGLIILDEGAQQTDAYQTNNNLMLSENAESNSLPGLEIKANDVKCSHGATTGRIDDSELFYFLARGIPKKTAQELMVFGYFDEILKRLDNEQVAEYVREKLQNKFAH